MWGPRKFEIVDANSEETEIADKTDRQKRKDYANHEIQ